MNFIKNCCQIVVFLIVAMTATELQARSCQSLFEVSNVYRAKTKSIEDVQKWLDMNIPGAKLEVENYYLPNGAFRHILRINHGKYMIAQRSFRIEPDSSRTIFDDNVEVLKAKIFQAKRFPEKLLYLELIDISQNYIGKGLGRILTEHAAHEGLLQGAKKVFATFAEDNYKAFMDAYEKGDSVESSVLRTPSGKVLSQLGYRLNLDASTIKENSSELEKALGFSHDINLVFDYVGD